MAMKKYLVLYHSSATAAQQMAQATPEQAKAGMEAWMSWSKKAGPALVDLGSPVGHGQTHASSGAKSDGRTPIGGFSILQAESPEALAALLKGHPHFMAPGASIETLEFLPIPGM